MTEDKKKLFKDGEVKHNEMVSKLYVYYIVFHKRIMLTIAFSSVVISVALMIAMLNEGSIAWVLFAINLYSSYLLYFKTRREVRLEKEERERIKD